MKKLFIISCISVLCSFAWQSDAIQKGKASYYATKFNGKRTASGDVFSQDSLTCAHKSLKFGTYIQVRNLSNDSTVVVKVNDRLGKSSARIIDVSMAAAKQLNFVQKGITSVSIEVLNEEDVN
jgi:rare lipoprotein A